MEKKGTKMVRTKQRVLAWVVALFMVLSLFAGMGTAAVNATTEAAGSDVWDGSIDISWYNTTDTEFHLKTPAQLAGLAAIVNGVVLNDAKNPDENIIKNLGTQAGAYTGIDDFKGKTVYLDADMDMGGVNTDGTWSGPTYAPIGGQWITQEGISVQASFNGVLDGQGHTVKNIYCNMKTGQNSQSVGLVGRLGCHDDDAADMKSDKTEVKNVAITGYIKGGRSIGGIVGKIGKTNNGGIIENCANFATVIGSDSKGTGGICGAAYNGGSIKNCYNAGTVTNTGKSIIGGIAGGNEIALINCYNVATITCPGTSASIATQATGGSYENCYWLTGTAGVGVYGLTTESVQEKTEAEMKSAAFVKALNGDGSAFVKDTENINNGYPILKWQQSEEAAASVAWDGYSVDTSWYNTADKEFTITTPAQLAGLAAIVNGTADGIQQDTFDGKTVTLGNDIQLDTSSDKYEKASGTFGSGSYAMTSDYYTVKNGANIWTPIGSGTATANTSFSQQNFFCGTFDGNGKTVSGLYTDGSLTVQGLFGSLGEGAAVKNLTTQGCVAAKFVAGGIAAYINGASITNCTNEAIVYADSGQVADSGIENGVKSTGAIGGIAGVATGTESSPAALENCVNTAAVVCTNTSKGGRVGGILGMINAATDVVAIDKCANQGQIGAYQYSGGIVGGNWSTVSPIDRCTNSGQVSVYSSGSAYGGGIVAYCKSDISNCYNTGDFRFGLVSGKGAHHGGIVSDFFGTAITNCYNTGSLILDLGTSSYSSTGAICGSGYGTLDNNKMVNCYALEGTEYNNADGYVTSKTEAELKASDMIEALGDAYYADLENINNGYPVLKWQVSDEAFEAEAVAATIEALGTVTLDSEAAVKEARAAYDALSDKAKELVANLEILTAAETKLKELQAERDAAAVIEKINAIGTVSVNSEKAIEEARAAYDALSEEAKALVTNTEALTTAEKTLTTLKKEEADKKAEAEKKANTPAKITSVKAVSKTYNSIKISWKKDSKAKAYVVYRATSKKGTYKKVATVKSTSYINKKLTTGKKYYYKVRAYGTLNGTNLYGAYSAIVSAKAIPATPKVTAKAGKKKVTLKWKKIAGASGYQVYRSAKKTKSYKKIKTITKASTVKYTNKKLKTGKRYYYKVRAYKKVSSKKVYGKFSTVKKAKVK